MSKTTLIIICSLVIMAAGTGFWIYLALQPNPAAQIIPANERWLQEFGDNTQTRIIFNIKVLEAKLERHQQQILTLIADQNDIKQKTVKKKKWF